MVRSSLAGLLLAAISSSLVFGAEPRMAGHSAAGFPQPFRQVGFESGRPGCAMDSSGYSPLATPAPGATEPGPTDPAAPATPPASPFEQAVNDSSFAPPTQGFAGTPTTVAAAGGYLDPAAPLTTLRFRYDAAFGSNFPDRGEYIYAKSGFFRTVAGPLNDPNAQGLGQRERNVDFEDYRFYGEYAFTRRFSIFTETAIRAIDPENNSNGTGFGDMNAGFKFALLASEEQFLTVQLRTYIPTGEANRGLGNGHVSIEPAILYLRQMGRWQLQGQIMEWVPINGSNYQSNVISYGAGLGYLLVDQCNYRITPVTELVGWTFLNGAKSSIVGQSSATNDAILNIKIGARIGLGRVDPSNRTGQSTLYFGYGHALTEDRLYRDLFRAEYRWQF